MAFVITNHWTPGPLTSLATCAGGRQPEPYEDISKTMEGPSHDGVWPAPPRSDRALVTTQWSAPIKRPTLIIWVKHDCQACKINQPFFTALQKTAHNMDVFRVEITPNRGTAAHVTVLPWYDVVLPTQGSNSVYGVNTQIAASIRNDERQKLAAFVPLPDL